MDWLVPAVSATCIGTALLAAAYYYLYRQEDDSSLLIWSLAWAQYAINTGFMLPSVVNLDWTWAIIGNQVFTLSTAATFLLGIYRRLDRRIPFWFWYVLTAMCFLILAGAVADMSFHLVALPSALVLGSVYIWNGWLVLHAAESRGLGRLLTGWAFILWGVHELDYPFLRPVEWFAPYGYLLATVFALCVAFGLVLLCFERARARLQVSEQRLRMLVENADDIIILLDTDATVLYYNGPKKLNLASDWVIGKKPHDLFPPEVADPVVDQIKRVVATGRGLTAENRFVWKGEETWWREQLSPVLAKDGSVEAIVKISHNITHGRFSEIEARRQQALMTEAELAGRLGSFWLRLEEQTMQVSEGLRRLLAIRSGGADLSLEKFLGCLHPADRELSRHHIKSLRDHKSRWNWDVRLLSPNGRVRTLNLMLQPTTSQAGGNEVLGIVVEVTDQRLTEQTREKYAAIVTGSSEAMITANLDMVVTSWNPGAEQIFGYRADEMIGESLARIVPEDHRMELERFVEFFSAGQRLTNFETVRLRKDGELIDVMISVAPIRNPHGDVTEVASVVRDITESNRMARRLRERESFLNTIIESSRDCIVIIDGNHTRRIIRANQATLDTFGYSREEVIGQSVALAFRPDRYEPFIQTALKAISEHGSWFGEWIFRAADGSELLMETVLSAMGGDHTGESGYIATMRDITARKKAELEMARADKLESIGLLAGGIAHDFNNILTGVIGNLSLAVLDADEGSELAQLVNDAQAAATRAQDLTHQLLTFSRGGAPVRKTAAVNDIIVDTARFSVRGSNVRVEFDLDEDLKPADIDTGQISQVIGNLVINASQAMPSGGTVRITARTVEVGSDEGLPLRPGEYVKISVADSGVGIPAKELDRIFEPFYTSKKDGNGLGLATSYAIVRNHDGYLGVESTVNVGTTFHIYLPVSYRSIEQAPTTLGAAMHGKGRVLIMDDEDVIRNVACRSLERLGYQMKAVATGEEAIELYDAALGTPEAFDLVILDLTVPGGMGGLETLEKLKAIDPAVKAVVCSGFASDPILANYQQYGFSGIVTKPFHVNDIGATVASVLTGESADRVASQPH